MIYTNRRAVMAILTSAIAMVFMQFYDPMYADNIISVGGQSAEHYIGKSYISQSYVHFDRVFVRSRKLNVRHKLSFIRRFVQLHSQSVHHILLAYDHLCLIIHLRTFSTFRFPSVNIYHPA